MRFPSRSTLAVQCSAFWCFGRKPFESVHFRRLSHSDRLFSRRVPAFRVQRLQWSCARSCKHYASATEPAVIQQARHQHPCLVEQADTSPASACCSSRATHGCQTLHRTPPPLTPTPPTFNAQLRITLPPCAPASRKNCASAPDWRLRHRISFAPLTPLFRPYLNGIGGCRYCCTVNEYPLESLNGQRSCGWWCRCDSMTSCTHVQHV